VHVRVTIRAAGLERHDGLLRTGDGEARMPRRIAVAVSRRAGRARLAQAPVRPEAVANELRADERMPLGRRPHAFEELNAEVAHRAPRLTRVDDVAAEAVGGGAGDGEERCV